MLNTMIQFGKAKHFSKVTLDDHRRYPVWTYAHDARHDEEWEKPVISTWDVTQEFIANQLVAIITLSIEGADLFATAWLGDEYAEIFTIAVWYEGRWKAIVDVPTLTAPIFFVSIPKILGVEGVRFVCTNPKDGRADRIT